MPQKHGGPPLAYGGTLPEMASFGGGLWHITKVDHMPDLAAYEIFPQPGQIIEPNQLLAVEVWKEPHLARPRIMIICNKAAGPPDASGLRCSKMSQKLQPFAINDHALYGAELAYQANFARMLRSPDALLEYIVRAAAAAESAWVQIAVRCAPELAGCCRRAIDSMKKASNSRAAQENFFQPCLPSPFLKEIKPKSLADAAAAALPAYMERAKEGLYAVSIRAACMGLNQPNVPGAIRHIMFEGDCLDVMYYNDMPEFERIMQSRQPAPKEAIDALAANAAMWAVPRWGQGRDYVPFLCCSKQDASQLLKMPGPSCTEHMASGMRAGLATPNISGRRQVRHKQAGKGGSMPGSGGLSQHAYILGARGCGKTSLVRGIFARARAANHAAIYVGSDRQDAVKMAAHGAGLLIDLTNIRESLSMLKLPPYAPELRQDAVMAMAEQMTRMLIQFFPGGADRTLDSLMHIMLYHLYGKKDDPTLADMRRIIDDIEEGALGETLDIAEYRAPGPWSSAHASALSGLDAGRWKETLSLARMFVDDPYLKTRLGAISGADFGRIVRPGALSAFGIGASTTPGHARHIAVRSVLFRIWQEVEHQNVMLNRARRITVAIDELEMGGNYDIIYKMLRYGATYGISLVLVQQSPEGLSDGHLAAIMRHAGVHVFGRLAKRDAQRVESMADPAYTEGMAESLQGLANYEFYASVQAQD